MLGLGLSNSIGERTRGDNLPVTKGVAFWIDVSDFSTITFESAVSTPDDGDGVAITQIDDKSGNDYHATQSTGTARPTYNIDIFNNRPALTFDGNSDWLAANGAADLAKSAYTMFLVYDFEDAGTAANVFLAWQKAPDISDADQEKYETDFNNDGHFRVRDNSATTLDGRPLEGIPCVAGVKRTSTTVVSIINNVQYKDPVSVSLKSNLDTFSIGQEFDSASASNFLSGHIAEIIIYDRELTDKEFDLVNRHLRYKWLGDKSDLELIPSLALYFDFNDLATITINGDSDNPDGELISQVDDKSGNDRHVTQSTSSQQPTYVADGIGGKGCAYFEESLMDTAVFENSNVMSLFLICQRQSDSGIQHNIVRKWDNTLGFSYLINTNDAATPTDTIPFGISDDGSTTSFSPIEQEPTGYPMLIEFLVDGSSTPITKINDLEPNTPLSKNSISIQNDTFTRLGSVLSGFDYRYGELVIYDRFVSDPEIVYIKEYLHKKWYNNQFLGQTQDLITWVDFSDSSNVTEDSFGITQVINLGSGSNFVQTDDDEKPAYITSGINGLPSLHLNSFPDSTTCGFLENTAYTPRNTQFTIFIVCQPNQQGFVENVLYRKGAGASDLSFGIHEKNDTTIGFRYYVSASGSSATTDPFGLTDNADKTVIDYENYEVPTLLTLTIDNSNNPICTANDVTDNTGITTNTPFNTSSKEYIGAVSFNIDLYIGEIIVYNKTLTTAQQTQITNYLKAKWNIPI